MQLLEHARFTGDAREASPQAPAGSAGACRSPPPAATCRASSAGLVQLAVARPRVAVASELATLLARKDVGQGVQVEADVMLAEHRPVPDTSAVATVNRHGVRRAGEDDHAELARVDAARRSASSTEIPKHPPVSPIQMAPDAWVSPSCRSASSRGLSASARPLPVAVPLLLAASSVLITSNASLTRSFRRYTNLMTSSFLALLNADKRHRASDTPGAAWTPPSASPRGRAPARPGAASRAPPGSGVAAVAAL